MTMLGGPLSPEVRLHAIRTWCEVAAREHGLSAPPALMNIMAQIEQLAGNGRVDDLRGTQTPAPACPGVSFTTFFWQTPVVEHCPGCRKAERGAVVLP